jgi:hypothetical protein
MAHIFLKNLEFKALGNIVPDKDFFYNKTYGAWQSLSNNRLLIMDKSFAGIASKKKDIETGEDQK